MTNAAADVLTPEMQLLVRSNKGTTSTVMPTFPNKEDERIFGKRRLAAAFRIFAFYGLNLGVGGHITYRARFTRTISG